jgi:hypothetical protein
VTKPYLKASLSYGRWFFPDGLLLFDVASQLILNQFSI